MPLSSQQFSQSLESQKNLLFELFIQIEDQDRINQLTGYSEGFRMRERAYSWIFADPEYYSFMGDEYREAAPISSAEEYNALEYYENWKANLSQNLYLTEIQAYQI